MCTSNFLKRDSGLINGPYPVKGRTNERVAFKMSGRAHNVSAVVAVYSILFETQRHAGTSVVCRTSVRNRAVELVFKNLGFMFKKKL